MPSRRNIHRIRRQILKYRHTFTDPGEQLGACSHIRLARQQHQTDFIPFRAAAQRIPNLQLVHFKTYILPSSALLANCRYKSIFAGCSGFYD
ncbi:hypothetical protein D3C76_1298270 [compost metagenome]